MSSVSKEITLDSLLVDPSTMIDVSVAYIMVWLSLSEGQLIDAQRLVLARYLDEDTQTGEYAELIIKSLKKRCQHLAIVSKNLQQHLSQPEKEFFIEQAIKLVLSKPQLAEADIHMLQFLADLFLMKQQVLEALFLSEARRTFKTPGDPSSVTWWEESAPRKALSVAEIVKRFQPGSLSEDNARQILNLAKNVSQEDVKAAYRKLAHQYHPDRVEQSTVDAATASSMFVLVKNAYEVLKG